LVIPAGYIVTIAGNFKPLEQGAHGMRWSYLDSSSVTDCEFTQNMLIDIMKAYPDMAEGDYINWAECLRKFVLPMAKSKA
jgi:hypothetical protein